MALAHAAAPTPARILDAARRRYLRFGPRKTTMDEVAREAGCSRATLYAHFESKRALYAGLLRREIAAFVAELDAIAAADAPAPRKLRRILETTVRTYAGSPLLFGAVTGDEDFSLESIARPVVAEHEARVVALLASLVEAGIAEGSFRAVDAEAAAQLMYRLGHGLVLRELAGEPGPGLERLLQGMDDLLAFGLVPRKGRR